MAAACDQIEDEIDRRHGMPVAVLLEGRQVPPSSFLAAMATTLTGASGDGVIPVRPTLSFPLCPAAIYSQVRVRSSELPDDFEEGTIVKHTHLQTWTVRPAVRL